jgi:hypothetical protein
MKRKLIASLSPLALLVTTGCETQEPGLPQSYRPVSGIGTEEAGLYRVYAYDPYYYFSGSIFPYKDLYWYGRPPFYTAAGPLKKFGGEEVVQPPKKAKARLAP